jgi:hypothetical protein
MNVEKTKVMRISRQPFLVKRQPFLVKIMIDQKQLENVEYFKYLGSILTNDGRRTGEFDVKHEARDTESHTCRKPHLQKGQDPQCPGAHNQQPVKPPRYSRLAVYYTQFARPQFHTF